MDTEFLKDGSFLKRSVKAIGLLAAMSAVAFAQTMTAADLFAPGAGICKVLGLLPYGGGVAMVIGGTMAGINYMSHDQESKQRGKALMEGLIVGGTIFLVLPMLVGFFTGMSVCA